MFMAIFGPFLAIYIALKLKFSSLTRNLIQLKYLFVPFEWVSGFSKAILTEGKFIEYNNRTCLQFNTILNEECPF